MRTLLLIIFLLPVLLVTSCDLVKNETPQTSPTTGTNASPTVTVLPGRVIPFEHFKIDDYYWRTESTAYIWVINSLQDHNRPQGIDWKPSANQSEPPPEILDFDFSSYFLILVFNGNKGGFGTAMKIGEIRQDKGTIYISAHLDDPGTATSVPIISSQYNVLKISKDNLTKKGEIIFVLIDESGKERATTTYKITN